MNTTIYCRTTEQGIHNFYMKVDGKRYYLFSQDYRKGVQDYYGHGGVNLDRAIDYSRSHNDEALMRTMKKIPGYIRYIENEFYVTALRRTAMKNDKNYRYYEAKRTA